MIDLDELKKAWFDALEAENSAWFNFYENFEDENGDEEAVAALEAAKIAASKASRAYWDAKEAQQ